MITVKWAVQEEVFIVPNPSLRKAHGTGALKFMSTLSSRRSLNWTHKRVSSRIPLISWMQKYDL